MNGDGKADLIALSLAVKEISSVGSLWIFAGNGDGHIQSGVSYSLPGSFPPASSYSSFVASEFNGDGKPDLVIVSGTGVIATALGKGDGTFSFGTPTPPLLEALQGPAYISAADLNRDGKLDVVFGFYLGGLNEPVTVALGNGDGTFQSPTSIPARLNVPNAGANQIALGDVNQDGIPDIVTAGGTILFGDGKGGFPTERDYAWNASGSVTLADFDGDGKIDIIVGNGSSLFLSGSGAYPSMTVMFGAGGGAFVGAPISLGGPSPAVSIRPALTAADFNGDGIPDLVAAEENETIDILKGVGDGTFTQSFQYSSAGLPPISLATADFNRDGKQDVVVLAGIPNDGFHQGEVEVFLGTGDGTLRPPVSFLLNAPNPAFIAAGDFNRDGVPDLVAAAQGGVWVWLGKGDGTFSSPTTYAFPNAMLPSLAIGDFNRDGKLDIAIANTAAQNVGMLLGKGDGTFTAGPVTPVSSAISLTGAPAGPVTLIADDFNNDGFLDLASALGNQNGSIGGGIAVLLGNGNGTFRMLPIDPEATGSIAAGDMNGDKIPDLIVADGKLGTVVRIGNGDGTFQPTMQVLSIYLSSFVIADFDLDGKLDIVGGISPTGVATLLNYSTPPGSLAVVSAASYLPGPFAPDEIVWHSASNPLERRSRKRLNRLGPRFRRRNLARPKVYYASPGQVNFTVYQPRRLWARRVFIVPHRDGVQSSIGIQIVPLAPALSTEGTAGIAAAYAIRVSPDNAQTILPVFTAQGSDVRLTPIDLSQPGSVYLLLFGTGFDAATAASTSVTINGIQCPVQYAGPQLTFAGFDQIGVLLQPSLAGSGIDAVQVTIGGKQANTVYISIQ